jgi:DNA polymerase-1
MTPWLVIDVSYLCYRAFYTTKDLSWKGKATGTIFGFLKSITSLKDQFATDTVAFCFEHPHLLRRDIYPAYKAHRHAKQRTPLEEQALKGLREQITALRKDYLQRIGFKNVFCSDGYESDDIMAAIAFSAPKEQDVILVTADADLWQCLRSNVSIWNPQKQKLQTKAWFFGEYGFRPSQWGLVKALAGCKGDGVEGIPRVGEKTACKLIMSPCRLERREREIYLRNLQLVQLPFVGCPVPRLQQDKISKQGWIEVCSELGMKSLAGKVPVSTRSYGRKS